MRSTAKRYLSLHLAAEQNKSDKQPDQLSREKVDAYRAILSSTLPEFEKRPDRVAQEVLTLLVGGSATTMRVMSRIVFHVNSTPHVLSHLRSTLDAIMPVPTAHPELEVLQQQRYLVSSKIDLAHVYVPQSLSLSTSFRVLQRQHHLL